MIYSDENRLQLSGLQHFIYCRRQWALIHIEQLWAENLHTVEGDLFHGRAHDARQRERRGDTLILRDLEVYSHTLGVSGKCDVIEFHKNESGVSLHGETGKWSPFPVEYKKGKPKEDLANELQLCCQAMCLEEMLCCDIPQGALFFGETRRRVAVEFTQKLRQRVCDSLQEMHALYQRGQTPQVKPGKACRACSLKELCLPKLMNQRSVSSYIRESMEDAL